MKIYLRVKEARVQCVRVSLRNRVFINIFDCREQYEVNIFDFREKSVIYILCFRDILTMMTYKLCSEKEDVV